MSQQFTLTPTWSTGTPVVPVATAPSGVSYRRSYYPRRRYYGASRRRAYYRRKYRVENHLSRKYPLRKYGRMYFQKGAHLEDAGSSWRNASDQQRQWRRENAYYGAGMYQGSGGFLHKLQKMAKKRKLGGMAMDAGIAAAKSYAGAGNYNDLFMSQSNIDSTPHVSTVNDETGDMVITHTEYIGEVYGNGLIDPGDSSSAPIPFESNKLIINPGMEKTFPWLSQIAANYQEYELDQLVFKFTPQLAEVSSNNGLVGQVLIVTQYKPQASQFKNMDDVMHYNHYSKGKTTEDITHGVECDERKLPLQKGTMFVRSQELAQGESINDYDWGYTQVCVHNTPASLANASLGSLEVYYTVKLSKPIINSSKGNSISKSCATTGIVDAFKPQDPAAPVPKLFQALQNNKAIQPKIKRIAYKGDDGTSQGESVLQLDNQTAIITLEALAAAQPGNIVPNLSMKPSGSPGDVVYGTQITLPAGYNGNFRVKVWLQRNDGSIKSVIDNPDFWDSIIPCCKFGGNVEAIADIALDYRMTNPGATSQTPVRVTGSGNCEPACAQYRGSSFATFEMHCTTSQATDREDNTIQIFMGYPRNSGSTTIMDLDEEHVTITSWTCHLEEYNPQFGTEVNPEVLYVTDRGEVENFEDIADA